MDLPARLEAGAAVALIAPAAHLPFEREAWLPQVVEILEQDWGLRVVQSVDLTQKHLYLAGSDRARAQALQVALEDASIRGIFAIRGGYGVARMLPHLQPSRWHHQPKWVTGFSDCTLLLAFVQRHTEWQTVHSPCLVSPQFLHATAATENRDALRNLLFHQRLPRYAVQFLQGGTASGVLAGGCLSVIAAAVGTPFALDLRGRILFLEEVREAPYRIDRMLTQLKQSGALQGVRGIVFGDLHGCEPEALLWEVIHDVLGDLSIPIAYGLPCGHGERNLPLLLGAPVQLQTEPPQLTFHTLSAGTHEFT
jgi:muramoyltetrapeptide carboxypeptidase